MLELGRIGVPRTVRKPVTEGDAVADAGHAQRLPVIRPQGSRGQPLSVDEVRAYRDMMLIIRDRIASAIRDGLSLEQAQAAGLTREYDERWDSGRRIGSASALIEFAYADMAN